MFLPVHNAYTEKHVGLITYQCLCEWVCLFVLVVIIEDFYHNIFHMRSQ